VSLPDAEGKSRLPVDVLPAQRDELVEERLLDSVVLRASAHAEASRTALHSGTERRVERFIAFTAFSIAPFHVSRSTHPPDTEADAARALVVEALPEELLAELGPRSPSLAVERVEERLFSSVSGPSMYSSTAVSSWSTT
jgi:hypothetical protein